MQGIFAANNGYMLHVFILLVYMVKFTSYATFEIFCGRLDDLALVDGFGKIFRTVSQSFSKSREENHIFPNEHLCVWGQFSGFRLKIPVLYHSYQTSK